MDLRTRNRHTFSGFTNHEIEKMEKLLTKSREEILNQMFCRKLASTFSRSKGRSGKPIVKWMEIHDWFENRLQSCFSKESKESPPGAEVLDLLQFEFEAKSSKDGAWYDVEEFVAHRFLFSGEVEVLVRYTGFGAEEDEWVIVRNAVRKRSLPLEHSECQKVNIGDLVVCFQETEEQARYYDAHVLGIERRLHDIRGCRCIFLIRYDHNDTEVKVCYFQLKMSSFLWTFEILWSLSISKSLSISNLLEFRKELT